MVFTSLVFVFIFLPIAMVLFYVFPAKWRTIPLLVTSAVFYAWGEPILVLLILGTGMVTYYLGKVLLRAHGAARKWWLTIGIIVISIPLVVFKYLEFVLDSLGLERVSADVNLPLPIGVSFYTFMSISYLVDIYRRRDEGAPGLLDFSGFLAMYPHLVAGPIVRWAHIGPQLANPKFDPGLFTYGAIRVATGLAKKAWLADSIAPIVDSLFESGHPTSVGAAWLAVVLYSLQIYLDFSAYSDIAIGLAAMMGVRFHENFRYPYLARSAREFWQRWHISLGSWFRDYVYIPLGGSRVSPIKVWRNLFVVWALTGLWHGAAWTFVLWGLYYGVLIGLERFAIGRYLEKLPRALQHVYGVLVAMLGWVLFRAVDVDQAMAYYRTLFGAGGVPWWDPQATLALQRGAGLAILSIALAAGIAKRLMDRVRSQIALPDDDESLTSLAETRDSRKLSTRASIGWSVVVVACMLIATAYMVSLTYAPFIYFRF